MTDLPTTGPPALDIRWGQREEPTPEGRSRRALYPRTQLQEAEGYLHPGAAAAAAIGAVERSVGLPDRLASVAISFDAPVPLGMDLGAVVEDGDDGSASVMFDVLERPGIEDEPVRALARASVTGGEPQEDPRVGAFRAEAISEVPPAQEHELYAGCFVCGQGNPQGLDLRPGWRTADTVVTAFLPSERMLEDGILPPTMIATLLSCPTLWACRAQLEELGAPAALLATYEVRFLGGPSGSGALRTVGLAGEPGDERTLNGASALVGEDGRVHATATATWLAIDEVPAREPGRPEPAHASEPHKGGRPEEHSEEDWGQPLPGRRETPGPRSARPGGPDEHQTMDIPVERDDPSDARRSLSDEG